jgi:putative transposase
MPSPQAKPLHASSLQQELLQRMERAHHECPTTGQTRSNHLGSLKGTSNSSIARYVHIDYETVRHWRDRWHAAESRLQAILRDRKAETAQSCNRSLVDG